MDSLPMAFGKPTKSKGAAEAPLQAQVEQRIDLTRRKDADELELPKQIALPREDDEDDEDAESAPTLLRQQQEAADGGAPAQYDDGEESEDDYGFSPAVEGSDLPITHEVVMKDHTRTVSALSIEPSGARLASGSYDYDLKLWDFGGMNSSFKPFRTWEVVNGHQVIDVQWSQSGDSILVSTAGLTVKQFDRNGIAMGETVKGDMYIRDLRNASGHVSSILSICWHPKNPLLFLTASSDSTLRIWDTATKNRKSKSVIVYKSKERGGRTKVTACAWSPDGKWIVGAGEDGSLQVWLASSNFARAHATVEKAHEPGTVTSSLVFSPDSKQLASRGGDGTVKLWDMKSFKKPLFVASSLPSLNPETNLIFSPNGQYLLTGTAGAKAGVLSGQADEERAEELVKQGLGYGELIVLRREDLGVVKRLRVGEYSVVKTLWNDKINQIITGSSDGSIHVFYSPNLSHRGVLNAVSRNPRRRVDMAVVPLEEQQIVAPHTLPMYKEDIGDGKGGTGKRKRERERHDPVKTMKPMPPISGPGKGGRLGASATQHVVKGLVWDDSRSQDPREALLKYATADVNDNTWTSAWSQTQPKAVFDQREPTPEPEDKGKGRK